MSSAGDTAGRAGGHETFRSEAERMVARRPGIRMVSVEAAGYPNARTRVTFEIINNALLYSKQFVEVDRGRELAGLLRSLAPAAARRAKLLHRIEAEDGVALVDALVEAAIEHAGGTVGVTVATLRGGADTVTLQRSNGPAVKAWLSEGRLVCSFELSPQLRWTSELLVIRLPLFEHMKDGLIGRPVSAIAEHPMLPPTTRIAACASVYGENELRLRSPIRIVKRGELG